MTRFRPTVGLEVRPNRVSPGGLDQRNTRHSSRPQVHDASLRARAHSPLLWWRSCPGVLERRCTWWLRGDQPGMTTVHRGGQQPFGRCVNNGATGVGHLELITCRVQLQEHGDSCSAVRVGPSCRHPVARAACLCSPPPGSVDLVAKESGPAVHGEFPRVWFVRWQNRVRRKGKPSSS